MLKDPGNTLDKMIKEAYDKKEAGNWKKDACFFGTADTLADASQSYTQKVAGTP